METKYDSYYDREIPYTMTFDELYTLSDRGDGTLRFREENVLAYIRNVGDKFRMIAPAVPGKNITPVFPGLAISSGEPENTVCKLVLEEDDFHNILHVSPYDIEQGHWYSPYKISFTPVNYSGLKEKMYFSDFVSLLNQGIITIKEWDDCVLEIEN
jgi:hypothetical protein